MSFIGIRILSVVLLAVAGPAVGQPVPASALTVGFVLPVAAEGEDSDAAVSRHFRQGLEMGIDEFTENASILGIELEFLLTEADTPDEAVAAFAAFVEVEDVALVVGALDTQGTHALSEAAAASGTPFLNLSSSADALRNTWCNPQTFHLEPSAGMYLDAIAGWYVRAGFRDWFFVVGDDHESRAQLERMRWSLENRHFGAREVGYVMMDRGNEAAAQAVADADPDVVLLLVGAQQQLDMLATLEAAGVEAEIAGYPYLATQTRAFFEASANASARLGTGRRATAWEPTLDAYGARELNTRYAERFGEPMETPAWAAFQAVKMVFEASALGGATDADALMEYFRSKQSIFDLWKGIGVTFRPWNQQMRQSLYLVKIVPAAATLWDRGLLVGELPAIYMPQTDPTERLDQLGDPADVSECAI